MVHGHRCRADDGTRTRDPHLGKVMRYQLRYVRILPGELPFRVRLKNVAEQLTECQTGV